MSIVFQLGGPSAAGTGAKVLRKRITTPATPRSTPLPDDPRSAGPVGIDDAVLADWPVRDQFGRGTCVAFAVAAAIELHIAQRDDMLPERLSEQALYAAMRAQGRPPELTKDEWDAGATLLSQARDVLNGEHGLDPSNPYRPVADGRPLGGAARRPSGIERPARGWPVVPVLHGFPPGANGADPQAGAAGPNDLGPEDDKVARFVELLSRDTPCPVAAGLPALPHDSGLSNWTLPEARRSGYVPCPEDEGAPAFGPPGDVESGHVVCLTGFRPDPSEPSGGWFVFRNSWGLDFASGLGTGPAIRVPPARGYGVLSATYIDRYCWEYLAPDPVAAT